MALRVDVDALCGKNLSEAQLKDVINYFQENFPNTYPKPNESNVVKGGDKWYQTPDMIISCDGCSKVGRISRVFFIPEDKEWFSSDKGIIGHKYNLTLNEKGMQSVSNEAKKTTRIESLRLIPRPFHVNNVLNTFKEYETVANMCGSCVEDRIPKKIIPRYQNLFDAGAKISDIKLEVDGEPREIAFFGKKLPIPLKPRKI